MSILLNIPMPPMGKARPRLGKYGVHMPQKYMQWKKLFSHYAKEQAEESISGKFKIDIAIITKSGKMKSDIDNAAGSILDALQDCQIISNDRHCVSLTISIHKEKRAEIAVLITEVTE